ncbi:IS3 family transposase [Desulfofundulus sp.]|uniref:IS3 family transposase n=1 Tax=Desulfofundulus sp. TaxID=2282750 RepID=UPI003C735CF9
MFIKAPINSFAEAYQVVSEFMVFYNNIRIHSGIHYLTPAEYYEEAKRISMKALPLCA